MSPAVVGVYSLRKSSASDISYLPPQLRRCFRGASPSNHRERRFQLLEARTERRPVRDSRWSAATACLNRFRGFYESISNWEKNILQCTDESIFLPTPTQNKTVLFFLFELYIVYYQFVYALCLMSPSWELVSVAAQAVIHNRR